MMILVSELGKWLQGQPQFTFSQETSDQLLKRVNYENIHTFIYGPMGSS